MKKMLEESRYTVVMSGYGMLVENGYPSIRDGEESYDIEIKYGLSSDELLNTACIATRPELFYEFYRKEILSALEIPPGKGYKALAELERRGLVQSIITRRIFGLPERAGCTNVINLHGSVTRNYCPHCKKQFTVDEIRKSKHVPLCPNCGTVIRPDVVLFGEQVDNAVVTRAAEEVEKADVLVVLGTKLNSNLCAQLLKYYNGNKLILITLYPHFSDHMADYVINRKVDETLDNLLKELDEEASDSRK